MMREIGSNFWLGHDEPNMEANYEVNLANYGINEASDIAFTSTGRSAESIIVRKVLTEHPKISRVALVPPFTCHTVIDPLKEQGFGIYAYPIDCNLNTTAEMLERSLAETNAKVVLMHRYFGFDTLCGCEEVVESYSRKGVIFIEDHTQSMFGGFKPLPAQYHFGSFRKWLGVPDGGFAATREGEFPYRPTEEHREMVEMKLKASKKKFDYMEAMEGTSGDKNGFLLLYKEAERLLDSQEKAYKMARESEAILASADLAFIKKRRRENYLQIYQQICNNDDIYPITPALADMDAPLYLPVYAESRERLQGKLSKNDVFAPILWPRPDNLPTICESADTFYRHALCLPIDQRYSHDDMQRVIECLRE